MGIYTGDAKSLGRSVPDSSVDLILCDPVYDQMGQYAWLGEFADRVLKVGGSLIAQCGTLYRYAAEQTIIVNSSLVWMPMLAERLMTGNTQIFVTHSLAGYKPHVWFTKGKRRRGGWMPDLVDGGGKQKRSHAWQDSTRASEVWISRLTEPGDVVVDPFCGSGMVPVATMMCGERYYLAFEIDGKTAEEARRNLTMAQQPPLIVASGQLEIGGLDG
jgi:hypothetical protein